MIAEQAIIMDLEELRAFLAIADTGSFLSAATDLGIPRGTLRRRVDALEARIGAPLVERSPKGVVLTDAGALLAVQGRRLVQSSSALLSAVRERAHEPSGELRVRMQAGLPPHELSRVFRRVREGLPKLTLRVDFSVDPCAGVLDEVDALIHLGNTSPPGWVAHELLRVPVRLLVHARYLERRGTPRSPDELARHTLLSWVGSDVDPRAWPLRDGSRLAASPVLVSDDAHVLRQAIIDGDGVGLVPDGGLPEPGVEPGVLVTVLEDVVGCELPLCLAIPALLSESPRVNAFMVEAQRFLIELGLRGPHDRR